VPSAASASRRVYESPSACPSRSSLPRRRPSRVTTRTSTRSERQSCAAERLPACEEAALALYGFATEHAEARGIILADTKFEFGLSSDGTLVLGDEALTPDSSRFWPVDEYEPGRPQPSFDKQFVRDWCEAVAWDKTPPGPDLPDDLVAGTRARYVEAFERLTSLPFERYLEDPKVVL
jgi:phosphoribosylaminoimidazole-succinocarboxamide synthase